MPGRDPAASVTKKENARMLNVPHWQRAGVRPSPWIAGEKPRPLQFIVDDMELDPSPALTLLVQFAGHRNPLAFASPLGRVGGRIEFASDTETEYRFEGQQPFRTGNPTAWWQGAARDEVERHPDMAVGTVERRLRLLDEARQRDWIDGLVMPFDGRLRERWRRPIAKAPLMTTDEAAALSGLYLRARGERMVEIDRHGAGIMASEERLYLLGATSLLPGYEVIWDASGRHWSATGDPDISSLTDAVAVRLGRALKARDYLNVRRRAANLQEIWSDVLYFFESVLVCLQGAADSAARLVHAHFGLDGSRRRANWGHAKWWSALERSDAPAERFDRLCLEDIDILVGELRNSIHGEVLTSEIRQRVAPGEKPATMGYAQLAVALDRELAGKVSGAAERQGGTARWSIHPTLPDGAVLIDPWRYSEAAIATTGQALSSVISALLELPRFSGLEVNQQRRDLFLGRVRQRDNARLLFGIEKLPGPPSRPP